jgi:hypothetical protein
MPVLLGHCACGRLRPGLWGEQPLPPMSVSIRELPVEGPVLVGEANGSIEGGRVAW